MARAKRTEQDLKQVFIGADWMMPVGPAALMPNIDFARKNGIDYWFGSIDLDLRYPTSGTSFWFGAGPTYGYLNGSGFSDHQWGWDVNAGVGLGGGAMKPYITGRYIKIKDFKTSGAAIGLRF